MCPLVDEWIKKMVNIDSGILLSYKKAYPIIYITWMDFEGIMLSEKSDRGKQIPHAFTYLWSLPK